MLSSSNIERALTKEQLLRKVSQEGIFRFYLGLTPAKGLFYSPFRKDNNPSCGFFWNNKGMLILKDLATGEWYDCFNVVQKAHGIKHFNDVLNRINQDIDLINKLPAYTADDLKGNYRMEKKNQSKIKVEIRDFRDYDLIYWNKFGITEATLKRYGVYPVLRSYLNDKLIYTETQGDPCYAYHFKNSDTLKLYRPLNKKYKWLSDVPHTELQGLEHAVSTRDLFITKSLKDVMTLSEIGINAVAVQSENSIFPTELLKLVDKVLDAGHGVYILYDNDDPGRAASDQKCAQYDFLIPLEIPSSSGCKDSSDFAAQYGLYELKNLFENEND
jgi:hypothetical protein